MGVFDKLKAGFKKTRDDISQKLAGITHGFTKIDEDLFAELEETLILSDFGARTAADICDALRTRVKREGVTDPSKVTELLRDIIAGMVSGGDAELQASGKPAVYLVIGVNGAGKTTSIGKLSALFKEQGKSVLVAAADTFRAAAIEQLETWTVRSGADIIKKTTGSDPASVVFEACDSAKKNGYDALIIDTAGRLHNKKNLMEELKKISRIIRQQLPEASIETLLVLDATTGQNAVSQAKLFGEVAEITGIILTKLDGTAKGGIIVSIRGELGFPVKLVGVGEKLGDLQPFDGRAFAEAIFSD